VSMEQRPVCLWRENSNRLASLWDIVKRIAAHNLVQNGRNLQALAMAVAADPQSTLTHDDVQLFLTHFRQMQHDCDSLGFVATGDLLKWVIEDFSSNAHSYDQARSTIQNVSAVYQQELSREFFCYIEADKRKYLRSFEESITNPVYGLDTLSAFKSSSRDMALAGNCHGCGFNDACVFHLMRVLEKGLASLAAVFSESFTYENWHNVIERVESKIRKIDSTFGTDWKVKQKFYAEAACEFMFFKDAWRNHVMHGRDEYDDERAENIYSHVCAFMKHLAAGGLKE
jgi:hypothetical protein